MLYQATLKLAHYKPETREALLPLLREHKRHVIASTRHYIATQAVAVLQKSPTMMAYFHKSLLKAGVPEETAKKAATLQNPFKPDQFVEAVEKGLRNRFFDKLIVGIFVGVSKLIELIRLPRAWLSKLYTEVAASKIGGAIIKALTTFLVVAVHVIIPTLGIRKLISWLFGRKNEWEKFTEENLAELEKERPDRLRTKRHPPEPVPA